MRKSPDGTAVVGDTVRLDSTEIRYVKLRKLLPSNYRGERDWGGMTLSYYGDNREIWAQLRFFWQRSNAFNRQL